MNPKNQTVQSGLKGTQSLRAFKLLSSERAPIYHNATRLPPFLLNNLKSQHRVVKEFEGQDAILKAFYFSLIKLAFEIECQEHDYVEIVKKILIGQREFGVGELSDKNFTHSQYRHFLLEFFQILEHQTIPNFEETIQWYPIIDEILLKMFKQIVPITLKLKDATDFTIGKRICQFLAQKFKVKMQIITGCFKFIQSEMFLYIDSLRHVYLIYLDQLTFIKEVTEYQSSDGFNQSNLKYNQSYFRSSVASIAQNSDMKCTTNSICSNSQLDQPRVFNTVINMLDSKKNNFDEPNHISHLKYRTSFGYNAGVTNMQKIGWDKINEKQKSSREQYYGQNKNVLANGSDTSSFSTIKGQMLNNNNYSSIAVSKVEESNHSQHSILSKKEKFSGENRKCLPNQQNSKELQAASILKENIPGLNPPILFQKKYQNCQQQRPNVNSFKKAYQVGSNFSPPPNGYTGIFYNASNIVSSRQEVRMQKQGVYDAGYERFTHNNLLQILEDDYKNQIKAIKQKYLHQRENAKITL